MEQFVINLESERLLLRNILPEDRDFIVNLWTDPDVTKYMGGPRDRKKLELNIDDNIQNPFKDEYDLWVLVDKSTGIPVGHCGLLRKEVEGIEETEVIYVLGKEFRGKGYAVEIARLLIKYAFAEKKLNSVIALIKPQNRASERVAVHGGMELEKEIIRSENRKMLLFRVNRSF